VSWSPGASGLISRVGAEIEPGGAQRAKESVGRVGLSPYPVGFASYLVRVRESI
jgi:hypothetical protein